MNRSAATRPSRTTGDVAKAWWALVLLPFAFLGAFLVGEGLVGLLGYEVGTGTPPYGVGMIATIPALLVFAIPAVVSSWFAYRAARTGHRGGWIPAGFLILVTIGFVILNTVPMGQ